MESERSRQLQEIIALSQQMLERAQAMAWQQVAELEGRRRQLVIACFQRPAGGQEAPEVAASIREILNLNDRITALGADCRQRLGGEIHTHNVGRNASAAYLSHVR